MRPRRPPDSPPPAPHYLVWPSRSFLAAPAASAAAKRAVELGGVGLRPTSRSSRLEWAALSFCDTSTSGALLIAPFEDAFKAASDAPWPHRRRRVEHTASPRWRPTRALPHPGACTASLAMVPALRTRTARRMAPRVGSRLGVALHLLRNGLLRRPARRAFHDDGPWRPVRHGSPKDGPVAWTTHGDLRRGDRRRTRRRGRLRGPTPPLTASRALTFADAAAAASEVTSWEFRRGSLDTLAQGVPGLQEYSPGPRSRRPPSGDHSWPPPWHRRRHVCRPWPCRCVPGSGADAPSTGRRSRSRAG
ncbi:hypothetical protein SVIOM342S_06256 [Streptomyces violaceorubidus]